MADSPDGTLPPDRLSGQLAALGPGAVLGSFRLVSKIGEGAMGWVYVAEDLRLTRKVAIKVMKPQSQAAKQKLARDRFLREARSAACIDHDRIVKIYDVQEANDLPYIVMELLAGEPLDKFLERTPVPPISDAIEIARQVAEALDAAHTHERKLIHRDIKPANVWLRSTPGRKGIDVRLLDFGLARAAVGDKLTATNSGGGGTPAYMSPEQWKSSEEVVHQSDLFSLGVMLYQMLTGNLPFVAESDHQLMFKTCFGMDIPPSPTTLNPAIPADLSAFVLRMIARDKAQRATTAAEVMRELARMWKALAEPTPGPFVWVPSLQPKSRPPLLDCTGAAGASTAEVRLSQQTWATYLGLPVESRVDLGGGVGMDFVLVPPGRFLMGTTEAELDALVKVFPQMPRSYYTNELPQHAVTITRPMYVGRTAVTQGQFARFAAADTKEGVKPHWPTDDTHPVVNVSWNGAKAFAEWVGTRELPAGFGTCRMPREAEWEYACRAGTWSRYPNGSDDPETLPTFANVDFGPKPMRRTIAVGSLEANRFGLYDTIGNVWEWCEDGYSEDAYKSHGSSDPYIKPSNNSCVLRGGSWYLNPWGARPANRFRNDATDRINDIGFRAILPQDSD